MQKSIEHFFNDPSILIAVLILYILCLPFIIRSWKHYQWKEKYYWPRIKKRRKKGKRRA